MASSGQSTALLKVSRPLHQTQRVDWLSRRHARSITKAMSAVVGSRWLSAQNNIIHDCDETFNYWEPLHYLVHGYGLQTWEYSAQFGLRSYLYLLLHALVVGPARLWFGDGLGKVHGFYLLRVILGGLSAATEASLVAAAGRLLGRRVGAYSLLLLGFASGCFTASTTFLPSTFSMYGLTLATALLLEGRPRGAVAVAAVGVLVGWPFSVLATAPLVLWALASGDFWRVLLAGVLASTATLVPSLLVDHFFYGRWTCSILNLVLYNVAGGGDSALYGVEGPLFYLRNAANNFNLALPLALALPLVMLVVHKKGYWRLLVGVSPLYLWLAFMSLQPHKEERFLFLVYPLLCLAAATTIEAIPDLLPKPLRGSPGQPSAFLQAAKWVRPVIIGVILTLSYCRSAALLTHYAAPMHIYRGLPAPVERPAGGSADQTIHVCVGSEWHRFPSSFFLPSPRHRVLFLDEGFRGLLPFPFNATLGGTAAAPPHFNNKNLASPLQFVESEEACDFLVELDLHREEFGVRGANSSVWEVLQEEPFLDTERSPPFYRAFLIPGVSEKHNVFGKYRLLQRKH